MNYDKITDPISPDAPCGSDLLAEDDPDFLDYFFEAPERMPTKYYDLVREELFDPKSIDFKNEEKQIEALLKRTRDLRLLGIQARFQILAGRLHGFCDAFVGIADLLEAHPADVHPQVNGDNNERRNALEELNTLATVTMPLQYATLVEDRRSGAVNQRMYLLATGQVEPREDESVGDAGSLLGALSNEANQKDVDKTHEKLVAAKAAVGRITAVTKAQEDSPFTPDIEKLDVRLGELLELIEQARPDLGGSSAEGDDSGADADTMGGDEAGSDVGAVGSAAPAQASTLSGPVVIPTHTAARAALEVVEQYFATKEPSAAALLLVTQARLLIGKPLVEALDTLLPDHSSQAKIDFGSETGFVISMDRLRSLSNEVRAAAGPDQSEAEGQIPASIGTRPDAATVIKAVEDFYRRSEPVSPIPILLLKARGFLDKDFHAIVKELMPAPEGDGN
ncbi:ImpA family type VI secretion system protein [Litoreibacter janthinus]|uniref:Type VI secretion system protein ImpA n=1 Tax=Litoreibacter janthinus TaxID=670154 RepID=A0A1I6IE46_9RHOB|nr:type VI secretion system ImpA family N-terminal domain-containing protein [Litoreibacter janthinus]SFR65035.1 type VI secretion system protein ImpA [Litoreibacter janthinus]